MSREVFISHCSEDASVAEAVCGALENAGITCWIAPRNIQPGENWGRAIIKAISDSRLMVLVFSGHTNASPHVHNEIERAVSRRITILPFRIEKVPPSEDLELFISSCHWLEAYAPPLDAKIAQLVAAAQSVLHGGQTESAAPAVPAAPPVAPRRKSASGIFIAAGVAMALLVAGAAAFFLLRAPASEPPRAAPVAQAPAPELKAAEPEKAPPVPSPAPATTQADDLAKAKKLEDDQDFPGALAVYRDILSHDKDNKDIRTRAENVIAHLEEKADGKPASYRLIDILNDLTAMRLVRASTFLGKQLRTSDPEESVKLFRSAGEQGDRIAMVEAGLMIASGHGVGRPNYEEAATWFKKASDAGSPEGMRLYADCLLDGMGVEPDEPEAARLYSSAMALGNVPAKSRLAMLCRTGRGLPAADPAMAYRLFDEASKSGFLEAQGNLGVMIMNGETVPPDPAKAMTLWKDGAEKGDEICMVFYATALENGAVGKPNLAEAREWYRKAARLRNARAIDWCMKNGIAF